MVLKYDTHKPLQQKKSLQPFYTKSDVVAGMIGAGSSDKIFYCLHLKNTPAKLSGIVTARPNNARNIADKNQFAFCIG